MTRYLSILAILFAAASASGQDAKGKPDGGNGGTTKPAFYQLEVSETGNPPIGWRPLPTPEDPGAGHAVRFQSWYAFNTLPGYSNLDPSGLPPAPVVIDLTPSTKLPMHLNDRYGDCYYAAIAHLFEAICGVLGLPPPGFTDTGKSNSIERRYLSLSGGDNGLSDQDVQGEMMKSSGGYQGYVADVPGTGIIDYLYVDPNNQDAMKRTMNAFGPILFTFVVAPAWINNSATGAVWDSNTFRANNNGHAVLFSGVDSRGYWKLDTWGTYVWITPAGVKACSPSAWVAFSVKWFDAKGYAPNKIHIVDLAKYWQAAGGKAIPASVISAFPPPGDGPTPPPTPTPTPAGQRLTLMLDGKVILDGEFVKPGTLAEWDAKIKAVKDASKALEDAFKNAAPKMDKKQSKAADDYREWAADYLRAEQRRINAQVRAR